MSGNNVKCVWWGGGLRFLSLLYYVLFFCSFAMSAWGSSVVLVQCVQCTPNKWCGGNAGKIQTGILELVAHALKKSFDIENVQWRRANTEETGQRPVASFRRRRRFWSGDWLPCFFILMDVRFCIQFSHGVLGLNWRRADKSLGTIEKNKTDEWRADKIFIRCALSAGSDLSPSSCVA